MRRKRLLALLTAAVLAFTFTACQEQDHMNDPANPVEGLVLDIYAPEELMPVMADLSYRYSSVAPKISIRVQYDEGAILAAKVEAGAHCDILISDETAFMDWLDAECGEDVNPNKNDKVVSATRSDLFVGPGNAAYAQEELEEGEVYTTTYSAAVCRATGQPYESEQFIKFMLSDDVEDVYEAYGFRKPGEAEDQE